MNRKQKKTKVRRRRAHEDQMQSRRATSLETAQETAKSQKKGEKQVVSLMERAGYQRIERLRRIRVISNGRTITRTIKVIVYKRLPKVYGQGASR